MSMFNRDKGIEFCGGMEDFYTEMLEMYVADSDDLKANILNSYTSGNWKDYATYVHGLKSTSRTLGADGLGDLAQELETQGKAESVDPAKHEELMELYEAALNELRATL